MRISIRVVPPGAFSSGSSLSKYITSPSQRRARHRRAQPGSRARGGVGRWAPEDRPPGAWSLCPDVCACGVLPRRAVLCAKGARPPQPRRVASRDFRPGLPPPHRGTVRLRGTSRSSPGPARGNGHACDTHPGSATCVFGGGAPVYGPGPSPDTWTYFYGRQYLNRVFIFRVLKEIRGYFQCHLIRTEADSSAVTPEALSSPFAAAFPQRKQRASPRPPRGRVASSQIGLSQPTVAYSAVSGNATLTRKWLRVKLRVAASGENGLKRDAANGPPCPVTDLSAGTEGGPAAGGGDRGGSRSARVRESELRARRSPAAPCQGSVLTATDPPTRLPDRGSVCPSALRPAASPRTRRPLPSGLSSAFP